MSTFGTPESVYEDNARKAAFDKKHKATKTKALEKNKAIDKKWDKYNASKGLTPSGKRKWHYYNSVVK